MQTALQIIIAIIALSLTPGLLFHFDVTPKVLCLLVGTGVCLLFFRKNIAHLKAFAGTKTGVWFIGALVAHLAWTCVATAWSNSRDLSIYGGTWRRFGLITFAALTLLTVLSAARMTGQPRLIAGLLRAVVLSGACLSVYGIFQYFGLDPLMSAGLYSAGEGPFKIVRPPGSFGHADYFATWLVFVVFAAVALTRLEKRGWSRSIAFATVGLAGFAILLTGTRASLLSLLVGGAVLIGYRVISFKRIGVAVTVAVLALAAFATSPAGAHLRARIHWSNDDPHGGARLLIWRDSLTMASAHAVKGFGPETFSLQFPQYESVELARAYPDFYHESPHNAMIDELTAKGVPGLLCFLAVMIAAVWPAARLARANWLLVCLLAAFVALFVCQQFSVFVVGTAFAFYLCAAMLVAAASPRLEIQDARPVSVLAFAVPALACSICLALYAARLAVGDYYLARVNSSIEQQKPDAARRAFVEAAAWLPPGPTDDLYFSRAMASLSVRSPQVVTQAAAWQEALNHAVRAVKTSEQRQNAWYSLALMLARENDQAGVERSLRNSIAWAPHWFKPHWKLAEILAVSGHRDEALIEAATAVDLDAGRDPEVSATFLSMTKK